MEFLAEWRGGWDWDGPRRVWIGRLRPICLAALTVTLAAVEQLLRAKTHIGWARGGRGSWHEKHASVKASEGRQGRERFTVTRPVLA